MRSKSKAAPQENPNWSQYGLKHGEEASSGGPQRPTTLGSHPLDPHQSVDSHYYMHGTYGDEIFRHEQVRNR